MEEEGGKGRQGRGGRQELSCYRRVRNILDSIVLARASRRWREPVGG
jgi:hypothetical protein